MLWSPKDFDDDEVNFRVVLADLCDDGKLEAVWGVALGRFVRHLDTKERWNISTGIIAARWLSNDTRGT